VPELAVIVPCFNERENVLPLVEALRSALGSIEHEIIFVDDDSEDGTAEHVRRLAVGDPRLRVIQRIGRTGLSSAVIEGMMSSSSAYLAVIDGDLQHDERVLPRMLERLKTEGLDLVIGTRNSGGGSMGEFSAWRVKLSHMGKLLSRAICGAPVSDPMSGFFVLDRRFLDEVVRRLSQTGFKILVDLLASSPRPVQFAEVPYTFRTRQRGLSKLNLLVGLEFLELILDKWFGNWIPVTYFVFAAVGTVGVLTNFVFFYAALALGASFATAFLISAIAVIALNFYLNNRFTFRSRRLRGKSLALGLLTFYTACGIGLFINLQLATRLESLGVPSLGAAATGMVLASVWNYWMTSVFVWQVNRRRAYRRRPLVQRVGA